MMLPDAVFEWFVTAMIILISAGWPIYDSFVLRRNMRRGKEAHDQIFGSVIGIVLGTIGLIGLFKYYLGL